MISPEQRALLEGSDFLRFLPPEQRRTVLALFRAQSFVFGQDIVSEGQPGDAVYLLASGRARVVKRAQDGTEVWLNLLKPGDHFGEMALLGEGARTASVRASDRVVALRLDKADFQALLRVSPQLGAFLEMTLRRRELHNFLRQFSQLGRMPLPALRDLLDSLEPVEAAAGREIISQGDPAEPMYVIRQGRVRVFAREGGGERDLAYLRPGDFFGELSALLGARRAASVQALEDCRLLALSPSALERLAEAHPEFKARLEERRAFYDPAALARLPLDFFQENLPPSAIAPSALEASASPAPPRPGTAVEPRRGKRPWWRSFPIVRQADEMDCGAAALAMVCAHFGKRVGLARLRRLTHTSVAGVSLADICRAATELGLSARSLKVSRDRVGQLPCPAIVHWQGNHWVVLVEAGDKTVTVADPARGLVKLTLSEFQEQWTGYAALFDYTEAFAAVPQERPSLAWLRPFISLHRATLLQALVLALVACGLEMLLPVFTQVIVDQVMVDRDLAALKVMGLAMLTAMVFLLAATLIERYLLAFVAVRLDSALLDYLTRRLLALPLAYFQARRTGDIQRRLAGARQLREFLVNNGVGGATALIQMTFALLVMSLYSLKLLAVFLACLPLYLGLMAFSSRVLRPIFAGLEESQGRYSSFQIEAIKGVEAVKAASAEEGLRAAMLEEFLSLAGKQFKGHFVVLGYEGALQAVGFLINLLFLWVGAGMVMEGELTIGAFVAFSALIAMALGPMARALSLWDDLQLSRVLLSRVDDIFQAEPEQGWDRSGLQPAPTLEGRVEINNLTFRFGGPQSPAILDCVNLSVPAGTHVAIVGRSGSGKSTLARCLAGLLTPSQGGISYDGLEMGTLNLRDLRRRVGLVPQESHLFDGSILANIALGEPEPDPERAMWAAKLAQAHDFISRLPLGYQSRVGESGLVLSGGQRQRLAVARALYHDPSVLILDEATSSLDAETEKAFQEGLEGFLRGRTAFIIAHRLSTIRGADLIVVLDQGRVVEQGTHQDLMERRGVYFYLCSRQMEM